MNTRLFAALWSVTTLVALALLVRNAAAIAVLAPLDPNEGWNAAHTFLLLTTGTPYPSPHALMVNNYPPLSFYPVAALTRWTGDAVIAGRILSLLSFLAMAVVIALVCRQMGCGLRARISAALFFAAVLLIASDYVAMDDPQLMGHAVQLFALLLLLRRHILAAAVIFSASLFIKHNLVALPLATAAWLLWQDRPAALRFTLCGAAALGVGLILFRLAYGFSLLSAISSPRQISLANVGLAAAQLWWALLPLAALLLSRGPWKGFCLAYAAFALALGLGFSAGDGVDANAFFDLAAACAIILALEIEQNRRPLVAALCAAPLPLFLALHFHDNNFFFTRAFAAQSARDVEFLKSRPGPVLCEQLSLCLWAGKGAEVDVFNIGEQIKTGARDGAPLAQMIAQGHFAAVQLEDMDALGPLVRAALDTRYRVHHSDDNGTFLTPAP
jgi:hypothetical protein